MLSKQVGSCSIVLWSLRSCERNPSAGKASERLLQLDALTSRTRSTTCFFSLAFSEAPLTPSEDYRWGDETCCSLRHHM